MILNKQGEPPEHKDGFQQLFRGSIARVGARIGAFVPNNQAFAFRVTSWVGRPFTSVVALKEWSASIENGDLFYQANLYQAISGPAGERILTNGQIDLSCDVTSVSITNLPLGINNHFNVAMRPSDNLQIEKRKRVAIGAMFCEKPRLWAGENVPMRYEGLLLELLKGAGIKISG